MHEWNVQQLSGPLPKYYSSHEKKRRVSTTHPASKKQNSHKMDNQGARNLGMKSIRVRSTSHLKRSFYNQARTAPGYWCRSKPFNGYTIERRIRSGEYRLRQKIHDCLSLHFFFEPKARTNMQPLHNHYIGHQTTEDTHDSAQAGPLSPRLRTRFG